MEPSINKLTVKGQIRLSEVWRIIKKGWVQSRFIHEGQGYNDIFNQKIPTLSRNGLAISVRSQNIVLGASLRAKIF